MWKGRKGTSLNQTSKKTIYEVVAIDNDGGMMFLDCCSDGAWQATSYRLATYERAVILGTAGCQIIDLSMPVTTVPGDSLQITVRLLDDL